MTKSPADLDPLICEFESVAQAIEYSEELLPGKEVRGKDPRWQAIIQIGHFIPTSPEEIWSFVAKWGGHQQEDLRDAVACLLLEHLLEHHFDLIFPRVIAAVSESPMFGDMFCRCWKFGESKQPGNSEQFDALQEQCRSFRGDR